MEQILLSSFFELILHVCSLRTRHDANEGECRLLFLTGSSCCLRYFSELGSFGTTTQCFEKVLRVVYMKGIIKQLFHFSL